MKLWLFALGFFILSNLSGCASESKRSKELSSTLSSYEHTIRWGKLENLNNYLKEPVEFSVDSYEKMKHIQVTSYRILTKTVTDDGLKQLVEIRYYNDEYAVERNLTDAQVWEFDEDAERWYLTSKIPVFK